MGASYNFKIRSLEASQAPTQPAYWGHCFQWDSG